MVDDFVNVRLLKLKIRPYAGTNIIFLQNNKIFNMIEKVNIYIDFNKSFSEFLVITKFALDKENAIVENVNAKNQR